MLDNATGWGYKDYLKSARIEAGIISYHPDPFMPVVGTGIIAESYDIKIDYLVYLYCAFPIKLC